MVDSRGRGSAGGAPPSSTPTVVGEAPLPGSPDGSEAGEQVAGSQPDADRIGRFLVLGPLGAGGMGVVYAAYDPQLDRKVAIKLLRAAAASSAEATDGTTRLLREAQALAQLQHPNVVAVHDVGLHAGRVFVAMEFVEGRTLGAWLREDPQGWREVRDVFVAAGRGLAAAHAAGLIHRDFKPDNVLIGNDGRVRVADFGLARAFERDAGEAAHDASDAPGEASDEPSAQGSVRTTSGPSVSTRLTYTGATLGTPAYMAPEQHNGEAVGPAADQFAFCVALYEALYGQRPFPGDTFASLAFQKLHGRIALPPRDRKVPAWLRKVVERGLSVAPGDRYPSMDALLSDLARDPSAARRRWVAALAVVGAVAGSGYFAWRAEHARAQVCRGFDDVVAEAWNADAADAVARAFGATGLVYASPTFDRVKQRLDAHAARWAHAARRNCEAHQRGEQSDRLLDLRSACLARRRMDMAALVEILSEADERTVRRAVEAVEQLDDPASCVDAPDLADVVEADDATPEQSQRIEAVFAALARARALQSTGRYDEARRIAEDAAREADDIGRAAVIARAQHRLAMVATEQRDAETAKAAVGKGFAAALRANDARTGARIALYMPWVAAEAGDVEAIDLWAGLARALAERSGDPGVLASVASAHGNALRKAGRYDRARKILTAALAEAEEGTGDATYDVALLANNLGVLEASTGDYAAAADHFRRARDLWEELLGELHPRTLTAASNAAAAAMQSGDLDAAERAMRRVVDGRARTFGTEDRAYADAVTNLALILARKGSFDEATALQRRLIDLYGRLDGPESVEVGQIHANLAGTLELARRLDPAMDHADRAVAMIEAARGPEHRDVAVALTIRGSIARGLGRLDRARADLERAVAIDTRVIGEDSLRLVDPLTHLALVLVDQGQVSQGLEVARRAQRITQGRRIDPGKEAWVRFALARASWASGDRSARTRDLAAQALALLEAGPPGDRIYAAEVRAWMQRAGLSVEDATRTSEPAAPAP